ncbi:MAG: glycerophosphodiester phosphodiesterase [Thaumarchaeota archaeon]|nr:glycerophosphodiester phosphodiesterase [Nitrososphaerota archaeon]
MFRLLNSVLKIGHRGAKFYEPENTLRSFRKALELGANAVELDVRRTREVN